jgi:hypothetical protein
LKTTINSVSGPDSEEMLAAGDGHATAAGVRFEAQLDAIFAC